MNRETFSPVTSLDYEHGNETGRNYTRIDLKLVCSLAYLRIKELS